MLSKLTVIFVFFSLVIFAQESSGRTAPNFLLEDVDGNEVELAEEIGGAPVIISFWATWCKPCVEELGEYQKLYEEFKNSGVKMFAISTDDEKSVAKVNPFVKSKGFDFTVLLDTNSDVARDYYARVMPFTVIIDKDGKIIYSHIGYKKGDELKVKQIISSQLEN